MRALVLDSGRVSLRTDHAEPAQTAGDVLVRVLRAGICETDLQLIRGYKDFNGILGHEFVGVAMSGAYEGQRVVGEINCSCWTCATCQEGRANHCPHRTVIGIHDHDGAFADLIAVPERNLHVVPDTLETDAAVFVEPVAAAFQIPSQVSITPQDRIIVLGDGRLGNLCAQVLASLSDHVTVVGKHANKLALLGELGIETCRLEAAPPARTADIVVDCTGSESGLPTALTLVRPRGTVVLKTTIAGTQTIALAPVVVDEVTVVGSRCGPFEQALDALANGLVVVQPLISDRFDLADAPRALTRAAEPGVLKVLLDVATS
jgi:threonine dehydrogenase-like Zn-dependent dehydrogenase